MFELVKAGGFVMLPILLCSIVAMAIIVERFWSLRRRRIVPNNLVVEVWQLAKEGRISEEHIHMLRQGSPLGRILAAGLIERHSSREIMKEGIEEAGRHVVHSLEQYLNTLGTIAAIAPLLGLLGTVIGMIKVFAVITVQGIGDPGVLASGISEALITTAAGLTVAIPSLIFYRHFRGRIDGLVVSMEQEALKMIEVLEGMRKRDRYSGTTK
uniref:Biopolymer transport protein ExbB n=2 Tax=unclassified Candidatus Kentrum TaxID=2643149 RepID=A0A451A1R4_9GAMM|nr:MAG: biopolymer transport protein ExbB [Candidatus Kentron sp. LPFa]VFK59980.1 MAG: biopolymer transport protein ExbB [Candidatus Kentron sp. UNK]VFK70185.1 MAG: biopolymer transport protein ExbB [Candidatus Kentron sp. UNK]